jgi:8-oxo-dGTP diphosphatase
MNGMNWDNWTAVIEATLMFVVKEGRILLIEKKRGHGQGKVNGPGGKIDPGESPLDGAVRETEEELCISVKNPRKAAELWFEMSDYPRLRCHVFLAEEFDGVPTETPEAVPLWVPLDEIPYERMWEDDQHWLPQVLAGQKLIGKFVFEGEEMREKKIIKTQDFETQDTRQ